MTESVIKTKRVTFNAQLYLEIRKTFVSLCITKISQRAVVIGTRVSFYGLEANLLPLYNINH